jgi:hypothetical protein
MVTQPPQLGADKQFRGTIRGVAELLAMPALRL